MKTAFRILFLGDYKSPEFKRLYDTTGDADLGGQRKISLLLRCLLAGGFQVHVVSSALPKRTGLRLLRSFSTTVGFPEGAVTVRHPAVFGIHALGGLAMCATAPWEVMKAVRSGTPHITFAYNCLAAEALGATLAMAKAGRPLFVEVDDLPGARPRAWNPKPLLDRALWRFAAGRASGFILVNADLEKRIKPSPRPWIELPGLLEDSLIAGGEGRTPPFASAKRVLLYTGGITKGRGAGILLDAVPLLPQGWTLWLTGTGNLVEQARGLARAQPGKCRYLGCLPRTELHRVLCTADALINPPETLTSLSAVFPFKIFEYLAASGHVISCRLPQLRNLDLGWCQRWTGRAEDLPALLNRAHSDYQQDEARRRAARSYLASHFTMRAVSRRIALFLTETVLAQRNGAWD